MAVKDYTGLIGTDAVYLPKRGGLGLRNFRDLSKAFGVKLWWRFRSQNSLWSKYLMQRYARNIHPTDIHVQKGSTIWRRMLKSKPMAEHHIRWLVGRGDIHV